MLADNSENALILNVNISMEMSIGLMTEDKCVTRQRFKSVPYGFNSSLWCEWLRLAHINQQHSLALPNIC